MEGTVEEWDVGDEEVEEVWQDYEEEGDGGHEEEEEEGGGEKEKR